jgi:Kef-type K+ transport system membrane component KefB
MPNLSLVANLGLLLFLFLQNWRVALAVGLAGMILPFGLGCGIAYGLYHQFRTDPALIPISFGVYMLFIGTALSVSRLFCLACY